MKKLVFITFLLNGIIGTSLKANATIISGGVTFGDGNFVKLEVPFTDSTPDNTLGDDTFQNLNLYGFDEGQNIEITVPLNVDDIADGSGSGSGSGTLPIGTTVASHYIFFDPLGLSRQRGFVNFDSNILAIISSTSNLSASDFLINTGVNYLNPSARGLENTDSVTITDLTQIEVNWLAGTPGDYVRVLTEFSPGADSDPDSDTTIPEPTSILALLGISLGALVTCKKTKKTYEQH